MGVAALLGGRLIEAGSFKMLGIISAASMAICFLLTYKFFGKEHLTPLNKRELAKEIEPSAD